MDLLSIYEVTHFAGNIKYNIIIHKNHTSSSTNKSKLIIHARSKSFKRWTATITDNFSITHSPPAPSPAPSSSSSTNDETTASSSTSLTPPTNTNNFVISVCEMYNLLDDAVHKRNNNLIVIFPEVDQYGATDPIYITIKLDITYIGSKEFSIMLSPEDVSDVNRMEMIIEELENKNSTLQTQVTGLQNQIVGLQQQFLLLQLEMKMLKVKPNYDEKPVAKGKPKPRDSSSQPSQPSQQPSSSAKPPKPPKFTPCSTPRSGTPPHAHPHNLPSSSNPSNIPKLKNLEVIVANTRSSMVHSTSWAELSPTSPPKNSPLNQPWEVPSPAKNPLSQPWEPAVVPQSQPLSCGGGVGVGGAHQLVPLQPPPQLAIPQHQGPQHPLAQHQLAAHQLALSQSGHLVNPLNPHNSWDSVPISDHQQQPTNQLVVHQQQQQQQTQQPNSYLSCASPGQQNYSPAQQNYLSSSPALYGAAPTYSPPTSSSNQYGYTSQQLLQQQLQQQQLQLQQQQLQLQQQLSQTNNNPYSSNGSTSITTTTSSTTTDQHAHAQRALAGSGSGSAMYEVPAQCASSITPSVEANLWDGAAGVPTTPPKRLWDSGNNIFTTNSYR